MSARLPKLQVSVDNFATVLTLEPTYLPAAPSVIAGWNLDGTPMSTGPDVLLTLQGLEATLQIYKTDDDDGQTDPREDGIQIPAGGPHTIRSPRDGAGHSTITISPRPPYPDVLLFELLAVLPAYRALLAQFPPPPAGP